MLPPGVSGCTTAGIGRGSINLAEVKIVLFPSKIAFTTFIFVVPGATEEPGIVAVMVVAPTPTAVPVPLNFMLSMVMTPALPVLQVTWVVTSELDPSSYMPMAMNLKVVGVVGGGGLGEK